MFAGINISEEIFAIDMVRALKSSLEHDRKHVLRLLRLYMEARFDPITLGFFVSL